MKIYAKVEFVHLILGGGFDTIFDPLLNTVFPHPSQNEIPYLFPTFSWLDDIPYQFYMKLCEIFLLTENISKYCIQNHMFFFNNLVPSVVKYLLFVFKLSHIFHTFENMKFPTFSWLFDPFPNPSWLCQPIPYLFKA